MVANHQEMIFKVVGAVRHLLHSAVRYRTYYRFNRTGLIILQMYNYFP